MRQYNNLEMRVATKYVASRIKWMAQARALRSRGRKKFADSIYHAVWAARRYNRLYVRILKQ